MKNETMNSFPFLFLSLFSILSSVQSFCPLTREKDLELISFYFSSFDLLFISLVISTRKNLHPIYAPAFLSFLLQCFALHFSDPKKVECFLSISSQSSSQIYLIDSRRALEFTRMYKKNYKNCNNHLFCHYC